MKIRYYLDGFGVLLLILTASAAIAQDGLLTKSVGGFLKGNKFAWHISDGNIKYCNVDNCKTPRNQHDPIPEDAGLYVLPNAGLWLMTPDGRYQFFCGIEPNCAPPRTRLDKLPNGMIYSFKVGDGDKLIVTDPRVNQNTWCSYEPNCSH